MIFSTTPLYALIVAVIWIVLWFRVRNRRALLKQSIGDGGDQQLLLRIRQHGNCAEWSGFILILMILAEGSGVSSNWLNVSGILLVIGRIAHPFGLDVEKTGKVLRYVGNSTNLLSSCILLIAMSVALFGAAGS